MRVDTTVPATPWLTFTKLANAYYDTAFTTLYVRPAAGGAFTVTAASSDADTGIRAGTEGYTFSPLNTTGGANFSNSQTAGANAYTFNAATTAPSSPATVSATNNAGASSATASYSVVADTAAPAAPTPTVAAAYYTTASVPVSVAAATDTGSGVAAVILQRDQAALSGTACGSFPDTFATSIVLSGGNDTTVDSGFCYQYRLRVTDKVGNQATSGPSAIAKVDTSAPSTPTLTFSSMTSAGASGTTVYARSAQNSGSFTVTAGSVDPETGVSFAFPTFPAGWTVVGSGGSRTYSWVGNATMPSGSQTVTVTNGAGLVATTSFTIVADNTGPAVSNVALANGTSGTAGTIGPGDSATITFSEQMEASRFCPSWTNAGVQTLGDVVITVVNQGGHDEISIVSQSCLGLNIATAAAPVNTNANYVRVGETVTFAGTVSWNPVTNTVRITVAGLTSGALSVQTGVPPKVAKYGPPANLTDVAGNGLPTSTFTSAAPTGF
ncbi:MAG: hypothetical protein LC708_02110 [Actinobacteria bacterium]|nr:hypothetical protein [Actinomycetota bacterium]